MTLTELAKKTKTWSSAITAAGLLIFLAAVGILTTTKNHTFLFSPEPDAETGLTPTAKERITQSFDDRIVGFDRFLSVYGITQTLLGTSVYDDAGYTYLIRDTTDHLHFHTSAADAQPYADAVAALQSDLSAADIPFLYLQAPTKEIPGSTDYPPGISYVTHENAAAMREALRAHGVDVLSFYEAFTEQGLAPETQFYRTDHHWTTETAFEAFRTTLPYLNERFGWSLDLSLTDASNWTSLYQPQTFLGSIGRRIGAELAGLDDYTYLEPAFETEYQVYYPPSSTEVPYWTGSFHHTMVRDSLLYSEDVTANRYASYFQYDYGELIIENMRADNDLHITVIKDSFALPFTAFLSTAVHKIDMIDLREFDGPVTEHLLSTSPDLVIMLYGNGSFSDVMYQFWD